MLQLQLRTKIARNHTLSFSTSSQRIVHTVVKCRFLKHLLRVKSLFSTISLPSGPMLKTESWNLETNSHQLSRSNISKTVSQNIVSLVMEIAQLLAQQDSLKDLKSDKNLTEVQLNRATHRRIEILSCQVFHQSSSRIKYYSLRYHKARWLRPTNLWSGQTISISSKDNIMTTN